MTDSIFSAEEAAHARELLWPYCSGADALDRALRAVMMVAQEFRQSLIQTVRNVMPLMQRPDKIMVVAVYTIDARSYVRAVGLWPQEHKVIMEPERLRGLSPGTRIVYVDRGDRFRPGMPEQLVLAEQAGAEVHYVSLDRIMGVYRDREGR